MTAHPSVDATLLDLADEGAPAARVCGYLNDSRPRKDVSESDVLWCLRQATHLQVVVDGVEEIRADVDEGGEVRYPVIDGTGERVCSARDVRGLLAGESFTIGHVTESQFDDGLRPDGGTDASGTDHVERVREALEEIDHLRYAEVTECPHSSADVRVQVAERVENALVNNGEFAQFRDAGYVGHHVDFERRFIDLCYVHPDADRGDSR